MRAHTARTARAHLLDLQPQLRQPLVHFLLGFRAGGHLRPTEGALLRAGARRAGSGPAAASAMVVRAYVCA